MFGGKVWFPTLRPSAKLVSPVKEANQKPYGLLNPLPIPVEPWESIGIDFIKPLPESYNHNGYFDAITVIICLYGMQSS